MWAMDRTKRLLVIGGSALAALLLAVVILLAVLVGQNARAADQERYDRARERCEELLGPMSEDNLDEYAACAERLLH